MKRGFSPLGDGSRLSIISGASDGAYQRPNIQPDARFRRRVSPAFP